MTPHFKAIPSPSPDEIASMARLNQHTPLNTPAYATACSNMGKEPCVLALEKNSSVVSGCLGFLTGGMLRRTLEIPTAPKVEHSSVFWEGVVDFCRKQRVWILVVESACSDDAEIPHFEGEINRRVRSEFVLDLTSPDLLRAMSTNHRRNIARAKKCGLLVRRTRDPQLLQLHLKLQQVSMERRKVRGEDVVIPKDTQGLGALLISEAGELFQVSDEEQLLSSVFIIRSSYSAYYQSAGTSEDGREKGASPFLISEVAKILQEEGVRLFNLGGAGSDTPGLQRFKEGFGARKVKLEAASFATVSSLKWKLRTAAKLVATRLSSFLN